MFTQKQLIQFVDKEFGDAQFDKLKNPLNEKDQKHGEKYTLYDLKYYENEMNVISKILPRGDLDDPITFKIGGNVLITKKYVSTKS